MCLKLKNNVIISLFFKSDFSDTLFNHMHSIGITATMFTCLLTQHLRELPIHEWLSNQDEYQPFFDGMVVDFEAESSKYIAISQEKSISDYHPRRLFWPVSQIIVLCILLGFLFLVTIYHVSS